VAHAALDEMIERTRTSGLADVVRLLDPPLDAELPRPLSRDSSDEKSPQAGVPAEPSIKDLGRLEEWTPPDEWVRRWRGRPMRNRYLYVGEYAYWFTRPRVPMLNRERVSVQQATPTRRVVER
jgi:hypothetical protein